MMIRMPKGQRHRQNNEREIFKSELDFLEKKEPNNQADIPELEN